jgi:hypothetical protein
VGEQAAANDGVSDRARNVISRRRFSPDTTAYDAHA